MLFTSFPFFCLLAVTLLLYYGAARNLKTQIGVLVVASLVFYAWENPKLLVLLAICTGIAAGTSWSISTALKDSKRQAIGGIVLLLGLLAYFKYAKFLYGIFIGVSGGNNPQWEKFFIGIPLPIGISFYVFHGISLIVDTWRGTWRPSMKATSSGHFGKTALYMVFFPQLIAGPITKAKDFFPQIHGLKKWNEVNVPAVLKMLIMGYFFKRVVADNLAADTIFMVHPETLPGLQLVILMVGYSFQIFADFFGYSLIALGLGRLFGYHLPVNFDRPYLAASFSEFWRRWHISLSSWLRDYLFIPLGGSRRGTARTLFNLFLVMFLGGLWHGAAWHFVLWGVLHGTALAVERPFLPREGESGWKESQPIRLLRIMAVFSIVTLGWLFFRPHHAGEIIQYLASIRTNWDQSIDPKQTVPVLLCMIPVILYHLRPFLAPAGFRPGTERWILTLMVFLIIVNSGTPGAFIYFQF